MSFTYEDPAFLGSLKGLTLLDVAPWANAYWTKGPEFIALGHTDGSSVPTWPDEIASANMNQIGSGAAPVFRPTGAAGTPSLQAIATSTMGITTTSLPQAWTFAAIGSSANTTGFYGGSQTNASDFGGLRRTLAACGNAVNWTFTDLGSALGLFELYANGASSEVYKNGTLHATGDPGTSATGRRMVFGRSTSGIVGPLTGHLCFAAWIGRGLTTTERANLTALAQAHHGTP